MRLPPRIKNIQLSQSFQLKRTHQKFWKLSKTLSTLLAVEIIEPSRPLHFNITIKTDDKSDTLDNNDKETTTRCQPFYMDWMNAMTAWRCLQLLQSGTKKEAAGDNEWEQEGNKFEHEKDEEVPVGPQVGKFQSHRQPRHWADWVNTAET